MPNTTNLNLPYPDSSALVSLGYDQIADVATGVDAFFGAWTSASITPGGITVGNGSATSYTRIIGKIIFVRFEVVFGSTTSVTGAVTFARPTGTNSPSTSLPGVAMAYDDSASSDHPLTMRFGGANWQIRAMNSSGTYVNGTALSSTIPFTWAVNDRIVAWAVYELI